MKNFIVHLKTVCLSVVLHLKATSPRLSVPALIRIQPEQLWCYNINEGSADLLRCELWDSVISGYQREHDGKMLTGFPSTQNLPTFKTGPDARGQGDGDEENKKSRDLLFHIQTAVTESLENINRNVFMEKS